MDGSRVPICWEIDHNIYVYNSLLTIEITVIPENIAIQYLIGRLSLRIPICPQRVPFLIETYIHIMIAHIPIEFTTASVVFLIIIASFPTSAVTCHHSLLAQILRQQDV